MTDPRIIQIRALIDELDSGTRLRARPCGDGLAVGMFIDLEPLDTIVMTYAEVEDFIAILQNRLRHMAYDPDDEPTD